MNKNRSKWISPRPWWVKKKCCFVCYVYNRDTTLYWGLMGANPAVSINAQSGVPERFDGVPSIVKWCSDLSIGLAVYQTLLHKSGRQHNALPLAYSAESRYSAAWPGLVAILYLLRWNCWDIRVQASTQGYLYIKNMSDPHLPFATVFGNMSAPAKPFGT